MIAMLFWWIPSTTFSTVLLLPPSGSGYVGRRRDFWVVIQLQVTVSLTRPRWPWRPHPRVLGVEEAFALICVYIY